jgi:hypothetical protein
MASVQVTLSPGFLRQGFTRVQLSSRLTTCKKTVLRRANCSSKLRRSSSLQTPNFAGAASLYLRGNDAPERSSFGVLETRWRNLFCGKSCSWEKSRSEAPPCADAIFKKFNFWNECGQEILWTSDLSNKTIGRPPQSRETIPLSLAFYSNFWW